MRKLLSYLVVTVLLLTSFAGCGKSSASTDSSTAAPSPNDAVESVTESKGDGEELMVAYSNRGMDNEYYVMVGEGMKMYLDSLGIKYSLQFLDGNADDEKQINDVQAFCEAGGDVLYVEPNNDSILGAIAEICESYGTYWCNVWSMLEGYYPMDYEYYAFMHSPSNIDLGYGIAKYMFDSFETPGKGNILIIQGNLGNSSSTLRHRGIERALAEYPNINVLDDQHGNYDGTIAMDLCKSWISKYGDEIDGIWCANDTMGLACVEALRAAGLEGKVLVCGIDGNSEALKEIEAGNYIASGAANAYMQGGYAISLLYQIWLGNEDLSSMSLADRMFFTPTLVVTPENVKKQLYEAPSFDYTDFNYFRSGGEFPYLDSDYVTSAS